MYLKCCCCRINYVFATYLIAFLQVLEQITMIEEYVREFLNFDQRIRLSKIFNPFLQNFVLFFIVYSKRYEILALLVIYSIISIARIVALVLGAKRLVPDYLSFWLVVTGLFLIFSYILYGVLNAYRFVYRPSQVSFKLKVFLNFDLLFFGKFNYNQKDNFILISLKFSVVNVVACLVIIQFRHYLMYHRVPESFTVTNFVEIV